MADRSPATDIASRRRQTLAAFSRTLTREAQHVSEDPALLWPQFYNRLRWESGPVAQVLAPELARRMAPGAMPWLRLRAAVREPLGIERVIEIGDIQSCAIEPRGVFIVVSHDHRLSRWDARTGQFEMTLMNNLARVQSCAISTDGTLVVAAVNFQIYVVDAGSGQVKWKIDVTRYDRAEFHTDILKCAISLDSSFIVGACDDNTLRIWNTQTGDQLATLRGHEAKVMSCAISLRGDFIASCDLDGSLKVWDVETWTERPTNFPTLAFHGHIYDCAISSDGRYILTACDDGTLAVCEASTGKLLQALKGGHGRGMARSCAISPDGSFVVAGHANGALTVWDSATWQPLPGDSQHDSSVFACAVTPDGAHIISASRSSLKEWAVATREQEAEPMHPSGTVEACAFARGGALAISAGRSSGLNLWDIESGTNIARRACMGEMFNRFVASPEGDVLVYEGYEKKLTVWDVRRLRDRHELLHDSYTFDCGLSPDASTLVVGCGDGSLHVWDITTGKKQFAARRHTDHIHTCAFTPDNKSIISASWGGSIVLSDAVSGRRRRILAEGSNHAWVSAIRRDGLQALALDVYNALTLLDLRTGEGTLLREARTDRSAIERAHEDWFDIVKVQGGATAFSPDGTFVAAGSTLGTVGMWDTSTARIRFERLGHSGRVSSCAVSPDGRFVASAGGTSFRLWDAATGAAHLGFHLPERMTAMALHPWRPWVMLGDSMGAVHFAELVGITYGPVMVTPIARRRRLSVRCPRCLQRAERTGEQLGRDMACPRCELPLHVEAHPVALRSRAWHRWLHPGTWQIWGMFHRVRR